MALKKKATGKYPGPGYDETGPGVPKYNPKASTKYMPAPMSAAAKAKAGARGKATNDKYNDLVSKITRNYRVTAKEASSMIKFIGNTAGGFKQGLKGVDFTKEIPKFVGGAVKANLQLPGTIAKMVKRNTKQTVKEFKKGYNKK